MYAASPFWLASIAVICPFFFLGGWFLFWLGYVRVFDKTRGELYSKVTILPLQKSKTYEISIPVGGILFTSKHNSAGAGKSSIKYSVEVPGIPGAHWVVYNKYQLALRFAEELSTYLEIPLKQQVKPEHKI